METVGRRIEAAVAPYRSCLQGAVQGGRIRAGREEEVTPKQLLDVIDHGPENKRSGRVLRRFARPIFCEYGRGDVRRWAATEPRATFAHAGRPDSGTSGQRGA